MPANKFATMLHRNTNKMVVILVYAFLEWILIFLLLLNSLFSYLITKFAKCVGLKPPCLLCSRVDHVLQPGKSTNLHKDLVCETHAAEISKLGYCSNHQRFAETQSMCVDCLASRPNHHENSFGMRHMIAFISWVSHEKNENGECESEDIKRCSCCNESMSSELYPPYLLMKPSWGDENFTSKGSLIVESIDDEKEGDRVLEFDRKNGEDHDHDHDHDDEGLAEEHHILSDIESFILREVAEDRSSSFSNLQFDGKEAEKEEKEDDLIITELDPSGADNFIHQFSDSFTKQASLLEDRSLEVINMQFEDYVACDTHRLIPVELIDSISYLNFESSCKLDEDLGEREKRIQTFASESPIEAQLALLEGASLLEMNNNAKKISMTELETLETSMTSLANFIVLDFEELRQGSIVEVHPQSITTEEAPTSPNDDNNVCTASEETENKQVDLPQSQEPFCSNECTQEDESSSSSDDDAEVQNAFDEFIAQNNLIKSGVLSNGDNNVDIVLEELDNASRVDLSQSEEPVCLCECTDEEESSTSDDDDDDDDDDTEVQNAFDEFIAHNNLNKPQNLSNGDDNIETALEEPDYTPPANLPREKDLASSCQCIAEDQSSTSEDKTEVPNAFGSDKAVSNSNEYAEMIEKTISAEEKSHRSSKCSESYEAEEDKFPETPSSVDGLHYLHKKSMLFEKRESGGEDSLDGSVASEVECGDPVLTIDRLKTALKVERRALSATYQELEEERSASAVATNQTMAMITRLQEEKAAMQMEALQYQRMMEEQAEYDQEALQLLNELMLKREKEKQELEKELEEYRQKVMDYEAKERLRLLKRMKDGSVRSRDSCSCSCSNVDYTDDQELSIDLNHEARDEDNCLFNQDENSHNNATVDTVSNLEDMALDCVNHISVLDSSLAEFEEERASILDQLKALEEKIISLEENEEFLDDVNLIEHSSTYEQKYLNEKCNFSSPEDNNFSNGHSDDKHSKGRAIGSLAKRLLPYLDAADNETQEEEAYAFDTQLEPETGDMQNSAPIVEMDGMKVSIEEEVDRVYERLQALETDREFLKHCVGSMQNGDKGVDLLQEILQHLRDLKTVEHRLKSLGNDPLE